MRREISKRYKNVRTVNNIIINNFNKKDVNTLHNRILFSVTLNSLEIPTSHENK